MSDRTHIADNVAGGGPTLSCLIVTSPRTESWLLSDILSLTGLVGQPDEYFRLDFARRIIRDLRIDTQGISRTYLEGIVARTTSANGVFSAKIHPHHFTRLVGSIRSVPNEDNALTDAELIEKWFPNPRYVRQEHVCASRRPRSKKEPRLAPPIALTTKSIRS